MVFDWLKSHDHTENWGKDHCNWDHEISIIVTSILTVLTVAIYSWKVTDNTYLYGLLL
jgi:hypothetical protein